MVMAKRIILQFVLLMAAVACFGQPVTITPPSATIEPGGSVTLTASGALFYLWSPATGLSTTEGPVTVASPTVTTTYTCSGYAPGLESVLNGDFEQGDFGFTSSYQYNSNLYGEGTYYVDSVASLHHIDFVGYGHGGTGNFMMVNGATIPGTNVWTEQISVQPNTNYAFSTWVCTLAGTSNEVALLQFSINGQQLGDVFAAPYLINQWTQFYELWNSGDNTTATITILNQNTVGSGNDFGLDDVSFCEIVLVGAPQCPVTVNAMSAGNDYQHTCFGETVEIPFLDNDQLLESCNNLGCQIIQQAAHGTASYADDVMTYVPESGFSGSDQFRYRISCGDQSAEANVFMTIDPEYREAHTETVCGDFLWHGQHFSHSIDTIWTAAGVASNGCDSIYELHLTAYPVNEVTLKVVSVCPDQLPYFFYGENYYDSADVTVVDTDIHGCDSLVRLVLTINDYYIPPTEVVYHCYDTAPSYTWNPYGNYEFTLTEDGFYTDTLPTEGCDGIFTLDLHFMQETVEDCYVPVVCDSYTWPVNGQTYTTDGDDYYYELLDPFPCQRTYHLHISDMHYSPQTNGIHCHGDNAIVYGDTIAVVTNTEFFSFQYIFYVAETGHDDCVWDRCEWTISKPSWIIEFDSVPETIDDKPYSQCKVYVADRDPNYVTLTATVKNDCNSITNTFYLKSSFLDIDEYDGAEKEAKVNIIPNPNNGQMELQFENLSGKLNIEVYDMVGNKIDRFEINTNATGQILQYNLQSPTSGVYFFVVTGSEDTITKKVMVTR